METKDNILSPEKLNSMMDISKKGMFITVFILLLVTAGIYLGLYFGMIIQQEKKAVYFDGLIDREFIYEYMARPENSNIIKEDLDYQLDSIWNFNKDCNEYALFSTVLSRREYDRFAPVLGAEVSIDGKASGYVVFTQIFYDYNDLFNYGFVESGLKKMNIYPGDDAYYMLSIFSTDYDKDIEQKYWDGTITFRNINLRKLLDGPEV